MKNIPIEMILSGPKCDEGMSLISTITSVGYDVFISYDERETFHPFSSL